MIIYILFLCMICCFISVYCIIYFFVLILTRYQLSKYCDVAVEWLCLYMFLCLQYCYRVICEHFHNFSMSPSATYKISPSTAKPPALAIGSLSTAQDGKYQSLISELESTHQVERQLLDRLVDQGIYTNYYKSTFVNDRLFPSYPFTTFILWICPYHPHRIRL